MRDELTRLYNRRAFNEFFKEELGRARRYGGLLGLAIFDLDHFKQVNDRYGHDAGDAVIRRFAAVLRECAREVDVPARYGGEEFTVLFPDSGVKDTLPYLEHIRQSIEDYRMAVRGGDRPKSEKKGSRRRAARERAKGLSVTVSIGVAGPDRRHRTPAQVIKAADEALYRAKEGGRNRVAS